ncbi:hypothetical protein [Lachnotalea glycerini]|uniref:Replication-associated protein ORF2/G2P domain-containing protein n=1 Tax=Lachnotalea glycerini TaxID=1763509 RepID=A0A371JCB9_9FIRM|nr:hypothetical protein [Lachnotalea glycerini]RDY30316.1 hypothetical protein CG710_015395 [Lachnotalea glycerini]
MAYWKDTWSFPNSIEYEYKFAGNYGAKGEKRGERKKATPEQIKKQNQLNKEKRMRRVIKANFLSEDYWITLKYPEGTRKKVEEVKKELKKFLDDMRKAYKKRSEIFKFIYRMEIGEFGGIHIHILLNRIQGKPHTDLLIKELWPHGTINYQTLYEYGGYKKLANYIVKPPDEEVYEQLSLFEEEEQKQFIRYSSSRNLIRPEPERKVYRRWTVKQLIEDGPKPIKGFYIDKDSIIVGVNKYTGMSYLQYTECRINEIKDREEYEKLKQEGVG